MAPKTKLHFCKCGCGQQVDLYPNGKCYRRYVEGHQPPHRKWTEEQKLAITGDKHPSWKGRKADQNGYTMLYVGIGNGKMGVRRQYEYEHRVVAAKALGRPLKRNECVHHINMNKKDNRNSNLLICSLAYNIYLLHAYAQRWAEETFGAG